MSGFDERWRQSRAREADKVKEMEKEMETTDALLWAFEHFYHLDCANAKIHCAPVRFSPLTFRLAEALKLHWREGVDWTQEMGQVLHDKGRYPEDPGRV